jgi:hypothetical protein
MSRLATRTAIALSCVAFFVPILWLHYGGCSGLPKRLYHTFFLGEQDFIADDTKFKFKLAGAANSGQWNESGFTTVRASDCIEVTSLVQNEASPDQALLRMEDMIRSAVSVVELGPKLDPNGGTVGKRAVLLFREKPHARIVLGLDHQSKLYSVESTSLAHALRYEQVIVRGYRYDRRGYMVLADH